MGARRRGGLDVLVDILRQSETGASKTSLVNRANLNSQLIERYLDFALEKGLMERVNAQLNTRQIVYRTTSKGFRLIGDYRELNRLLEGGREQFVSALRNRTADSGATLNFSDEVSPSR